ncbi:MAG: putative nucleotidyltransferase substrate binding domain-containing protein, partial [Actinomycetota bacterium]
QAWVDALHAWMRDPGPSGSILSSIVYDFRRVTGPLDPEPELRATIFDARNDVAFLRHLGHRVLDHRPPTGFLRDLVVERKGEHVGHLDAKHGGITIIGNIARLQGVRAGIAAKETLDRLAGAATAGTLEEGVTGELSEAFRFLWEVRLRHQAGQVRGGEPPDDFVDPSTLGPVMRRGLKEAFGVISRAQRVLAVELGLHMP